MTTTSTATATGTSVGSAYSDLLDALRASDPVALDVRVAEHCTIVGPKGYLIGRTEWIDTHNGQVFKQISLETLESRTQTYDQTAVRLDLQRSECLFQGEHISGLFRVISCWHDGPEGWQLTAIQYTSVSPEAAQDIGT
jgi:hypothetical protein